MARIDIEKTLDCNDTSVMRLIKKKGKISKREAYEVMEKNSYFGKYLLILPVLAETPDDLYEESDVWELYRPEDLFKDLAKEQYDKGYKDCEDELKLEAEWITRGSRVYCGGCGSPAPMQPTGNAVWKSKICPTCGAMLKNWENNE